MNNKLKAILILVVFAIICIGSYLIFEPAIHMSYEKINLTNSCFAEVPVSDKVSEYTDNLGIKYYSDYEHGLNITSFNTQDNVTASQGTMRMERIRSGVLGHKKINESGVIVYRNDDLDNYGMFVDDKRSHNQILIISEDLDMLIRVYKSLQASVVIDSDEDSSSYDSGSSSANSGYSSSGSSYSGSSSASYDSGSVSE